MNSDDLSHRRPIRSFVLRTGRLTPSQARAIDTLSPKFVLPFCQAPLNFHDIFGNTQPVVLEIGFGMGDTTAEIAAAMPDKNFIGIEVHTPGVGHLLHKIDELELTNLRIISHDAVEVIAAMMPEQSLAGVHVFFPDPWHKKRHHKRRLLQTPFVHELARRLAPGGYLHIATDWADYAEAIADVVNAEPLLKNNAERFSPKPAYRPLTKFENRGLKLGHDVFDIVATRRGV
jgi:tRNA (guanine-N7-)-methyltransferase